MNPNEMSLEQLKEELEMAWLDAEEELLSFHDKLKAEDYFAELKQEVNRRGYEVHISKEIKIALEEDPFFEKEEDKDER